jgi:hypothetical protein
MTGMKAKRSGEAEGYLLSDRDTICAVHGIYCYRVLQSAARSALRMLWEILQKQKIRSGFFPPPAEFQSNNTIEFNLEWFYIVCSNASAISE